MSSESMSVGALFVIKTGGELCGGFGSDIPGTR